MKTTEDEKREPVPFEDAETLKAPDQKDVFWTPTEPGETLVGKVVVLKTGKFTPVLTLSTAEGIRKVSVNAYLSDVDWDGLKGQTVFFRFEGLIGARKYRSYTVKRLKS